MSTSNDYIQPVVGIFAVGMLMGILRGVVSSSTHDALRGQPQSTPDTSLAALKERNAYLRNAIYKRDIAVAERIMNEPIRILEDTFEHSKDNRDLRVGIERALTAIDDSMARWKSEQR